MQHIKSEKGDMEVELSNFLIRSITGFLGGCFLIWMIYLGFLPFFLFVAFLAVLGLMEFYSLAYKIGYKCNIFFGVIISILISSMFFLTKGNFSFDKYEMFLPLGFSVFFVLLFSSSIFFTKKRNVEDLFLNSAFTITGVFYVSWLFNHLILIREIPVYGRDYVFILFFCVWALDIFAYIFGMKFGKHRLAEKISPKKSIEGSIAGFVFCVLTSMLLHYIFKTNFGLINSVYIGLIIGIFGQLGDLFESLIKRAALEKDSGNILPGHGGILDRFDSIIFTAPLFYYFVRFFVAS